MTRRSISLAFIFAALFARALPAQVPVAADSDGLVGRFMAFVERSRPPDSELIDAPFFRQDLERLNPGREDDVARIIAAGQECSNLILAAMPRAARNAARALGEERLARLVAFLEGPAGEALERLTSRRSEGPLSEAQREELHQLHETEAMDDFARWMYSLPNHVDPADAAATTRCYEELAASAARLGLRLE